MACFSPHTITKWKLILLGKDLHADKHELF